MPCEECQTTEGSMTQRGKIVLCQRCAKIHDHGRNYITRLTEAKLVSRLDGGGVLFLLEKKDDISFWFNTKLSEGFNDDEQKEAFGLLFRLWESNADRGRHARRG